jgi:hypothetical protein
MLTFSAPPEESRLVSAHRAVHYESYAPEAAPAASQLKASLTEKFGQPTEVFQTGNAERLTWLWARDGRLLTKDLGSPCSLLEGALLNVTTVGREGSNPAKEKIISDGCALRVEVTILTARSGVVNTLSQRATDIAGGYRSRLVTYQAVQDAMRKQNEKELERAKQRKPML